MCLVTAFCLSNILLSAHRMHCCGFFVCISELTVIILPCATLIHFHYLDGQCRPCGRNRMFQYPLLPFVVPVSKKDKHLPSCFHRSLCCAPCHQLIPICLMPFAASSCHVAFGSLFGSFMVFNPLALELDIYSLAHHLCKT